MVTIRRGKFLIDPVFRKLYEIIKRNHKVASHTEKVLIENQKTPGFTEIARHFSLLPGRNPIYLEYEVESQLKSENIVNVKFTLINIYDDYMEYETARMKSLHSGVPNDNHEIN